MEVAERIKRLQRLDLFEHLTDKQVHRDFVRQMEEKRLDPGEILFKDNDPGDAMYVLLQGTLEVKKDFRIITRVDPVDFVGEMALIEDKPRSATVVAIKPSLLLRVNRALFEQYLHMHPGLLLSITRSLSRKIRNDTETITRECERANILLHDIKNQLTPFLYLDLLADSLVEAPARKYLRVMLACRQHLAALTDEAMAVVKRQNRPYVLRPASLAGEISDLLENELANHPDLRDKSLQLVVLARLKEFPFHRLDIRRVLINLILNSGQASPPGSTIVIEIDRQDEQAVVRVRDHGPGIPPELNDRVFAAHFTTKPDGNGLGLTSCRQIVEQRHGGQIGFVSTPGRETVFTFTLPMK